MKILLIRLRLIGDVVFTTPLPRALKRAWPGSTVAYLVEQAALPVVATNASIDELIAAPRTRGLQRVIDDGRLARRLRRHRFDLVIDLHGGPRSSWLTLATGAPRRIGYAVKGRSWMYTTTVARPRELRPRHSVVNQWGQSWDVKNLFLTDGAPFPSNADKNPTLTIMALAWRSADYMLAAMKRREL